MTGELELTDADGERFRFAVGEGRIALDDTGLVAVPVRGGVRIEPARVGASLHVDGEELFCVDLRPGDSATVDGLRLRLLGEGGLPVVARPRAPSSRRSAEAAPTARRRTRPDRNRLLVVVPLTALVLVGAYHAMGSLFGGMAGPADLLSMAEVQFSNNRPDLALATLDRALRNASGAVRKQALELQQRIRQLEREREAALEVSDARNASAQIEAFAARWLREPDRPAARECVRRCDDWLRRFGEVCSWHSAGKAAKASVQALRNRWLDAAHLDEPDTAADAVFAARARLQLQTRDYVGAWRRLDGYLAAHPGDSTVTAEKQRMLAEGEPWLGKRLRRIDRALANGDLEAAERELRALEERVAIPAWRARIAERRQVFGTLQK